MGSRYPELITVLQHLFTIITETIVMVYNIFPLSLGFDSIFHFFSHLFDNSILLRDNYSHFRLPRATRVTKDSWNEKKLSFLVEFSIKSIENRGNIIFSTQQQNWSDLKVKMVQLQEPDVRNIFSLIYNLSKKKKTLKYHCRIFSSQNGEIITKENINFLYRIRTYLRIRLFIN